jgi:hypothetical protein
MRDLISKSGEARTEAGEPTSSNARDELKKDLDDKSKVAGIASPASTMQEQESDRPDDTGALGGNKVATPSTPASVTPADNRKLIRNAQLDLEVANYDAAVQRLTALAAEEHGFVATQNSAKLPNGKLQGTVVIKVLPENLDRASKGAGLGELKTRHSGPMRHQSLFRPDAACAREADGRPAPRDAEQNTGRFPICSGRKKNPLREQIEQMQGELKCDALVKRDRHSDPRGKRFE